jgi:membrane protein DedA with SNARE-associated domain
METAYAWIHSYGYLAVLLLMMLRIVGLPIRNEIVFLFVGSQRVQGT